MQHQLAHPATDRCLNCGAALSGAFCAACGQRSVPADPSVAELAGDAWQEFSGLDGRIAETFRGLLQPGRLTIDYIAGRRARYLSPVKLYLTVSVIYFLVAAAAPQMPARQGSAVTGPGGIQIGVTQSKGGAVLTEEDRAEVLKQLDTAPWLIRPMLKAVAEDPVAFRERLFAIMPRVFFGMLPVFAAIVALFYRTRRFPAALVFAAHLHAFVFMIFSVSEAAKFTHVRAIAAVFALAAAVTFAVYALRALRAVFGGSWPKTIFKAAGIGVAYSLAAIPAFLIILIWASLT